MRLFTSALLAAATLAGAVGSAQSLALGDPGAWMVFFQHDGRDTTGYVLYAQRDGQSELRLDLGYAPVDATGTVHIPLPKLTPGTYRLAVAAYNNAGESARIAANPSSVTLDARSAKMPDPPKPVPQPVRATPRANSPKPAGTDAPKGGGAPKPAAGSPPPASGQEAPASSPPGGILNRLWRIVAGSDN